jgi:hypothetical protein
MQVQKPTSGHTSSGCHGFGNGKLREQAFEATLECLGQTIQQLRPRTGRVRLAMPRYIGCSEQGRTRRGRKQWARHLELIKVFCQQHPSVIISIWQGGDGPRGSANRMLYQDIKYDVTNNGQQYQWSLHGLQE